MNGWVSSAFLLSVATVAFAFAVVWRLRTTRKPDATEPIAVFRICLPRAASFPASHAAAWFAGLAPLLSGKGPAPWVELCGENCALVLRIGIPAEWEAPVRAQLAAWFPESRLEIDRKERISSIERGLRLAESPILPLRTANTEEPDPLLGIIALLTQQPQISGVRISWSAAPSDWKSWAPAALAALSQQRALPPRGSLFLASRILGFLKGASTRPTEGTSSAANAPTIQTAAAKVREPVYSAAIVAWASGESPFARAQASAVAQQLEIAFRHPFGNELVEDHASPKKSVSGTERRPNLSLILAAAELAALFHLPPTEHPLLPREPIRRGLPPPSLRFETAQEPIVWLGEALTPEASIPFGLRSEDRRFHTYVVGKTGTGKSTFLAHIARQDLEAGRGVGLIDPHGDLSEQLLALVPPERHHEVLYFNPADAEFPVGFNLLASERHEQRPLIASGLVGVFKKLYGESWGPRLEYILRNAVLALLESPSPSLLALPRLLTDQVFRERLLVHVRDPLLRSFFLEEYARYDPRWRSEAIAPILNKVGQFLSSPLVRHVVGQSRPGFNLRRVMDSGGIFIANLASGKIGEDNAALVGGLLVAGFQIAALSRADQPEAERRDFFLSIDEFQHFANDAFAGILSEARKYRLSLTLSHQYLDQLPPGISDAVFGNAGSLCSFRVGAQDTTRLAREFAPVFDPQDLVHLPNHQFCARINRNGETLPAFSARTVPLPVSTRSVGSALAQSRRHWARPRAEVEIEIADAWEGRSD